MAHEAQERYSALVKAKVRKELVLKDGVVFNNDYEGDPTAGAVKIPVRDTEVAVSDYDKANGITAGTGGTSYETMPINVNDTQEMVHRSTRLLYLSCGATPTGEAASGNRTQQSFLQHKKNTHCWVLLITKFWYKYTTNLLTGGYHLFFGIFDCIKLLAIPSFFHFLL